MFERLLSSLCLWRSSNSSVGCMNMVTADRYVPSHVFSSASSLVRVDKPKQIHSRFLFCNYHPGPDSWQSAGHEDPICWRWTAERPGDTSVSLPVDLRPKLWVPDLWPSLLFPPLTGQTLSLRLEAPGGRFYMWWHSMFVVNSPGRGVWWSSTSQADWQSG